jgi:hypothetical protein
MCCFCGNFQLVVETRPSFMRWVLLLIFLSFTRAIIVLNCENNICWRRAPAGIAVFIFSAFIVPCAKSIVSSKTVVSTCLLVRKIISLVKKLILETKRLLWWVINEYWFSCIYIYIYIYAQDGMGTLTCTIKEWRWQRLRLWKEPWSGSIYGGGN